MFVSQTHLPQLLDVSHYTDPEFYQREVDSLLLHGWHCIGLRLQFPKDGDFRTTELFERPLISWRCGEQIHTFLNVCTHRFSTLTDKPCGHFDKRMKCQYHGWEFDETGNTCKIPDAQCFRPLKKGELGLKEYRTECIGQLVFMTFNDHVPPLRDWLGPEISALCDAWFTPQHRLTNIADMQIAANWKIVVENVLESYHLACVHAKSFSKYPDPAHCIHEFHPTWDHYIHDYKDEPENIKTEQVVCRITGQHPEFKWHHILRYPNVVFGGAGPFHYLQMLWPTSPTTCRTAVYSLHYAGPQGKWWSLLMHRLMYRYGRYVARRVQQEDAAIYPSIQRGSAVVDRPHGGGLISAREERIFAFQEMVLRETGEPVPQRVTVAMKSDLSTPAPDSDPVILTSQPSQAL